MTGSPKQLPLDLPIETRLEAEDFLVSPSNEAAYHLIDQWPNWTDRVFLLTGPEASGKSHLAAIWAKRAKAWTEKASDIKLDHVPHLVSSGALVIENCDQGGVDEHALFHLINAARERGTFVLLTARSGPDQWGLKTPDVVSRLRLAPEGKLASPDDALLGAVLVKLFVDRQLVIDTTMIDFIKSRIVRSIAAARDFVQQLDREGLARGKPITKALASQLLKIDSDSEVKERFHPSN
jgi:chromosomal replication initiation ATPase DnaA